MSLNEQALRKIIDPAIKSAGLMPIQSITMAGNNVFFSINISSAAQLNAAEESAKFLQQKIRKELNAENVKITITNAPAAASKKLPVPSVKKIILVASGKGGVGKSTIAFNLAVCMAEQGLRIGIVDADIYGPSLPTLCGITEQPILEENMMIPHEKFGIQMMSIGFLVNEDSATVWRGPMTTKALYQLIRMTKWDNLDYLIIDTPPGTGDVHLSLAENYTIDAALVISTPQILSTKDTAKSINMYKKLDIPILGIVENMSFILDATGKKQYIFGQGATEKLAKESGLKILAQIPLKEEIASSTSTRKPFAFYNQESEENLCMSAIAIKIQAS